MPILINQQQYNRLNQCFQTMPGLGPLISNRTSNSAPLFLKELLDNQTIQLSDHAQLPDIYYKLLYLIKNRNTEAVDTYALSIRAMQIAFIEPLKWSEFLNYNEQRFVIDLAELTKLQLINFTPQNTYPAIHQQSQLPQKIKIEPSTPEPQPTDTKVASSSSNGKRKTPSPQEAVPPPSSENTRSDELIKNTLLELAVEKKKVNCLESKVENLETEVKRLRKAVENVLDAPEVMTMAILKALGWKPEEELSSKRVRYAQNTSSHIPLEQPPLLVNAVSFSSSQEFLTFSPSSGPQSRGTDTLQTWSLQEESFAQNINEQDQATFKFAAPGFKPT